MALTQAHDEVKAAGGVVGLPAGTRLLLSEEDVLALVRYLVEPQVAIWSETPTVTEPGDYAAKAFVQPGLVTTSDTGEIVNGEARWSPAYFRKQKDTKDLRGGRVHTLPWKLPVAMKTRRSLKLSVTDEHR